MWHPLAWGGGDVQAQNAAAWRPKLPDYRHLAEHQQSCALMILISPQTLESGQGEPLTDKCGLLPPQQRRGPEDP